MCTPYFIIGRPHNLINEFGAMCYGVISQVLKHQPEVENVIVPKEEIMAHGFVADYGVYSQSLVHNE